MEPLERLEIKDFLPHQPYWGQGLGSSDSLCIPEPGHYLAPPKFKSYIGPWNSWNPGKIIEIS